MNYLPSNFLLAYRPTLPFLGPPIRVGGRSESALPAPQLPRYRTSRNPDWFGFHFVENNSARLMMVLEGPELVAREIFDV